ncbi:hypothetical protein A0O34_00415 [Chryseobacterium glaciei]|uniref:Histidine kinase domain-containing protein n=1 Tax=Chryseobacterium glaciei TaxID=1685010 RepID=A0A172XQ12_9FLAO|nr:HAMP domain-containing sensor histidine kinase [Chryseobacterium glaciei]ANF49109.1 hypothetical protein A0O34_00415 [Chryseobacterium glaciei]
MKLYYVIAVFFSLFIQAQNYTSQWYNMDNGLPQNSIKDIVKDKYGFIWLATDGGIMRYDGKNFLLDSTKISSLSFFDFETFGKDDFFSINDLKREGVVISERKIKVFTSKNNSFVYNNRIVNGKVYRKFNKNSFTQKFYPDTDYYYIKIGSETYFFGKHSIEYKNNGSSKTELTILQNFNYNKLANAFVDHNTIYIGDHSKRRTMIIQNGKVSYDNNPSIYNDPKTKIYWHQATGQVFIINEDNIYLNKIENGKMKPAFLLKYKGIQNEFVGCMFYDESAHKIYLGSAIKGLNIITLSNFYISQKKIPFADEVCYASLPFSKSSVISKDGVEYFKDKTRLISPINVRSGKRYMLYDDSKNLMYVEYNKLHRRYRSSQYKRSDSLSFSHSVEGWFKSNGLYMGNIIDAKNQYYLYLFTNDKFQKITNSIRFRDNINCIIEYNKDMMYVGCNDGIYLVSIAQNKIIKKLTANISIKEISRTKDGNFWFTTYNKGWYLLKNHVPVKMPDDMDGYISSAHTILEDNKGFFWISSNNGLFRVAEKMLLNYAKNKNNKVIYYRYSKLNGLLNNEFNSAHPGGNILENGEFVFPSMEGFVFFKPDEVKNYYPKPNQIYVERANIDNHIVNFKDKLQLKSNFKTADIYIDIPYFSNIENIYLEGKLENSKNEKWENISNERKYSINDIDPGEYNLIVRFIHSENGKFTYKTVPIEIEPFFYQTLIFKIIAFFLIFGAIVTVIQMRTNFLRVSNKNLQNNLQNRSDELEVTKNKLKNESEYQQNILQSISHDITTPVKFISLLSQKLNETEDIDDQKKFFEAITKASGQLFKFTQGLKEYTELFKAENILEENEYSLYDLVENKKLLFEEISAEKNTTIHNFCNSNARIKVNISIISAILHNLIDNAVKNTVDGEIIITNDRTNGEIEIRISDTGKGMSTDQIEYYNQLFLDIGDENLIFAKKGLGLPMVIQLAKKIRSRISFHNNTSRGTIVKILI